MSLPPTVTEEGVLCGKKKTKTTADPTLSFCYDPGVGGEGGGTQQSMHSNYKSEEFVHSACTRSAVQGETHFHIETTLLHMNLWTYQSQSHVLYL